MFRRNFLFLILFTIFCGIPMILPAQGETNNSGTASEVEKATPLFHSEDILHLKLTGNLNELFKDIGDNNLYHPILLQYTEADSSRVDMPISVKTRGHYRKLKEICKMPPLLLDFPEGKVKNTLFAKSAETKIDSFLCGR